jgi:hypothetical protein
MPSLTPRQTSCQMRLVVTNDISVDEPVDALVCVGVCIDVLVDAGEAVGVDDALALDKIIVPASLDSSSLPTRWLSTMVWRKMLDSVTAFD